MASIKQIPFDFVLEQIAELEPYTKMMFGCHAIYVDGKIVFINRQRGKPPEDDGIWLATTGEHHASLKGDFPSMRSITIFGPGPTGWQVLPVDADDFEESALRACEFVLAGDVRIGKVPKTRIRKSARIKKSAAPRKQRPKKKRAKSKS